jgi:PAS domain S-box-containing protein
MASDASAASLAPLKTTSSHLPENRLLESQLQTLRRYAAIIESSDDAILSKDLDDIITSWNPAAERVFGYSCEEAIGQPIRLILPEECLGEEIEFMARLRRGESVEHFETIRRRKDGKRVDILVTVSPIRDTDGSIVGMSKILRDISDRKRTGRQASDSLREIANLKTSLDEHAIVAITNRRGDITHVNRRFCDISKYAREELLGHNHRLINSGYHSRAFFESLWSTISSGRVWNGEIRNRAKDGSLYWVDTTIVPFLDERGQPEQYVAIRTDITALKLALDQVTALGEARDAAKALELIKANKELEAFAYSVSHDLRAPLRHMDGFAELLRKNCYEDLDAQGQRYLDKITGAARRMGNLIDDLLGFSRLLQAPVSATRVSLHALQEEVRRELEPDFAGRSVKWIVGDLPDVRGDRSMLRQVFANLLSNAVKYTRDRSEACIEIGCSGSAEGKATIFVRDNGAGFEMQYVGKLFEIFQRLHSDEFEGTGIGLANVRRIVERHGGHVWAEGAVDRGATFHFSLPLERSNGS